MNTTTATRYTPDDAILTSSVFDVPDHEHQRTIPSAGYSVSIPSSPHSIGEIWFDGVRWCWRTPTASAYGREMFKRYAIAALLDAVQQ